MSNHLVNLVKAHSAAKGTTRSVLWAIADRINGDDGAWSIGTIRLSLRIWAFIGRRRLKLSRSLRPWVELSIIRTKANAGENFRNVYKVNRWG